MMAKVLPRQSRRVVSANANDAPSKACQGGLSNGRDHLQPRAARELLVMAEMPPRWGSQDGLGHC